MAYNQSSARGMVEYLNNLIYISGEINFLLIQYTILSKLILTFKKLEQLELLGRSTTVKYGLTIIGEDDSPFWLSAEAKEAGRIMKLEVGCLRGVKIMTDKRLLQRLKKHDCSRVYTDKKAGNILNNSRRGWWHA